MIGFSDRKWKLLFIKKAAYPGSKLCHLIHFMNFNNDHFFPPIQGVKGALGDPGLPGPTGIRGGFGERVSGAETSVCLLMLDVF